MRKVSKKLISLVLAFALVFGCFVVAFAADDADTDAAITTGADDAEAAAEGEEAEEKTESDYKFVAGSDGLMISAFTGEIGEDGTFTLIATDDFDKDDIREYVGVEAAAFEYDSSNPDLEFLKDVKTIIVEDGVKEIGEYAFAYLPALEEVIFKGDVELGNAAFISCPELKTVTFEGDCVRLGARAFAGCYKLAELNAKDDVDFDAGKGALNDTKWFKDYTVDFVTVGTTLVAYKGSDSVETIPLNITAIGTSAFEGNKSLKKIIISRYVTAIRDRAFADSGLREVEFSPLGEITEVGKDAFANTPYFNNYEGEFFIIGKILVKYMRIDVPFVIIPNTVTTIADYAFDDCYTYNDQDGYSFVITGIAIPASVTDFGENCFALETFKDGSTYSPRLYAYPDTPAMAVLEEEGYLVTEMPAMADLNRDGKVTAADARLALRIAVRLDFADALTKVAADVDGDDFVTAADARFILRMAVGLEDVTSIDLLYMPKTPVEILMAYTAAVKRAGLMDVGYTKTVANTITGSDVNLQHKAKIEAIASKSLTNSKTSYASDTQEAIDNLVFPKLLATGSIKKANTKLIDGKYYITMKFEDVEDALITVDSPVYVDTSSYLDKIIPNVDGKVFYDAISSNSWFNLVADSDNRTLNCVRKYAMTYTDPTITAVIDVETGNVESIVLSVGYRFAVDGRVNGVDISSKGFKTGDGVVTRLDKVTFSDFQWGK